MADFAAWGDDRDDYLWPDITGSAYAAGRREIEGLQKKVTSSVEAIKEELRAAHQRITQLESTLTECQSYFENASDVIDGDYGVPAPNREMTLLIEIDAVLLPYEAKIEAVRKAMA